MFNKLKKLYFIMFALLIVSSCAGCSKLQDDSAKAKKVVEQEALPNATEEVREELTNPTEEVQEELTNPTEEVQEYLPNPLKGMDIKYPGAKKEDDVETASVLTFFLDKNSDIPKDEILVATVDDFDLDEKCEAFIFVGKFISDEYEKYYEGTMWFTNGKDIKKLNEYSTTWWSVDGFMSFDGRKYAYATMYYVSGGISSVWSVYDGMAEEAEIDGLGSVRVDNNGEIIITNDLYDTTFDSEIGSMIGHSWKPYYFFYDKEQDKLCERAGSYIAKSDIDSLSGMALTSLIEDEGHEITYAFVRDNGMITVNYRDVDNKGDIYFGNVNYNINTGKYSDAWGEGKEDMDSSNYGGIYLSTLSDIEATYPEVNETTENIELTVTSYNNAIQVRDCVLLSGRNGNGDWISVVVDKNTLLGPNDEALFPDREESMTAVDWLYNLIMIEQESKWTTMKVEGVYKMQVTNGHADLIEGMNLR